jgi:hypothetical protein
MKVLTYSIVFLYATILTLLILFPWEAIDLILNIDIFILHNSTI